MLTFRSKQLYQGKNFQINSPGSLALAMDAEIDLVKFFSLASRAS